MSGSNLDKKTTADLRNPDGEFFDFVLHGSRVERDVVGSRERAESCSQLEFAGRRQCRTAADRRHAHLQLHHFGVQLTNLLPANKKQGVSALQAPPPAPLARWTRL